MQISFTIEAGEPNGKTFRLALGITIPLVLVMMVIKAVGLI